MRDKSKEKRSNQAHVSVDDSIHGNGSSLDRIKRYPNKSMQQLFDDDIGGTDELVDGIEDYNSLDNDVLEEDDNEHDTTNKITEDVPIANNINQLVTKKPKRTRGPSMCKNIHTRSFEDRKPIILNELCQPIGPNKVTVTEFNGFLGSVARSKLVPLNKVDWHQVTGKDQIWDYVKTKYVIPEEGKEYVLRSVGALWRAYKGRIKKKKYYKSYDNMADRWSNRPKFIPDNQYKELLKYWSLKQVQDMSEKNKKISENQKDRHTMGTISYARKRHELEQMEKKMPSEARLYTETRKRIQGKEYMSSCVEHNNVEDVHTNKHRKLSGRCTSRVKGNSKSGTLIPEEYLQPYKASIIKQTVNEVLNVLQQVLPSDVLAAIPQSAKDPSNYLINGESSNDINDEQQIQNNEYGDKANDDDDALERNDDGFENEMADDEWR